MAKSQKSHLKCYGVGTVNGNGQITIPSDARGEIGMAPNDRVMIFGDPVNRELVVFRAPPDDKLFDLARQHARAPEDA